MGVGTGVLAAGYADPTDGIPAEAEPGGGANIGPITPDGTLALTGVA